MSTLDKVSPRILDISWGRMEIEGLGQGRDFKLWPGGGRTWDWSEFGTGHVRGVQLGDVKELVAQGAEVVVLTRGVLSRLRIPAGTREFLESSGVKVEIAATKKGVELYNTYVEQGVPVGGLFHSTC
jgi:hypothetical protein